VINSQADRRARRRVPVPRAAVVLAGVAVTLEFVGYVLRVSGAPHAIAHPLSMDAPFSLARMFVATLFATAAVAALLGSRRIPGRRTWWAAVAALAAGVATVKAGGDVHVRFMHAVAAGNPVRGLLISAPIALAAVGWLWWLSRNERRDRRRILTCLGAYAFASVGLSFISSVAAQTWGSTAGATATFFEESGEALSGVAFLFAVLLGVAPRLVLADTWPLRRSADAHTLDVPVALPQASEATV
jgi:hypothetical protein